MLKYPQDVKGKMAAKLTQPGRVIASGSKVTGSRAVSGFCKKIKGRSTT